MDGLNVVIVNRVLLVGGVHQSADLFHTANSGVDEFVVAGKEVQMEELHQGLVSRGLVLEPVYRFNDGLAQVARQHLFYYTHTLFLLLAFHCR